MGTIFVFAFLAAFTLAIGSAVIRRARNPYAEVPYEMLPAELRSEIERVLPGFEPGRTLLTKHRDEARARGAYLGAEFAVEADFDPSGRLVDFEAEHRTGKRRTGTASPDSLPLRVREELDRVLGKERGAFEIARAFQGTAGDEPFFEVKGRAGDWRWEVAVTESGRLLEVERELPRR